MGGGPGLLAAKTARGKTGLRVVVLVIGHTGEDVQFAATRLTGGGGGGRCIGAQGCEVTSPHHS